LGNAQAGVKFRFFLCWPCNIGRPEPFSFAFEIAAEMRCGGGLELLTSVTLKITRENASLRLGEPLYRAG
jgi:hypothetical protein